eukprot:6684580-Pyramimonas_sp.AAC.1
MPTIGFTTEMMNWLPSLTVVGKKDFAASPFSVRLDSSQHPCMCEPSSLTPSWAFSKLPNW